MFHCQEYENQVFNVSQNGKKGYNGAKEKGVKITVKKNSKEKGGEPTKKDSDPMDIEKEFVLVEKEENKDEGDK